MPHTHHTESVDSNPPLEIKHSSKVAAPLSVIVAFSSAIVATALAWSELHDINKTNTQQIESLANRTRVLEEQQVKAALDTAEIKGDVRVIRAILEQQQKAKP